MTVASAGGCPAPQACAGREFLGVGSPRSTGDSGVHSADREPGGWYGSAF